jgi:hypothetical protein
MDSFDKQLESNKPDYNEIPPPEERGGFNAKAQRDQFLGGGGSETKAPDATSSVPVTPQLAESPINDAEKNKERYRERRALVRELVQLEQQMIKENMNDPSYRLMKLFSKADNMKAGLKRFIRGERESQRDSMSFATEDAFWKPDKVFTFPGNHWEEAQRVRDKLAESARLEREEWFEKELTDEERRILRETPEYTEEHFRLEERFREKHYDAWRIAHNIGYYNWDRDYKWIRVGYKWVQGNRLQGQDKITAALEETQKKESKTEAKSLDKNDEPDESTAEQATKDFTVTDTSGNSYPISVLGELTTHALVEALKDKSAGALAAKLETLSHEQKDLNALLTTAKITVTPL